MRRRGNFGECRELKNPSRLRHWKCCLNKIHAQAEADSARNQDQAGEDIGQSGSHREVEEQTDNKTWLPEEPYLPKRGMVNVYVSS